LRKIWFFWIPGHSKIDDAPIIPWKYSVKYPAVKMLRYEILMPVVWAIPCGYFGYGALGMIP